MPTKARAAPAPSLSLPPFLQQPGRLRRLGFCGEGKALSVCTYVFEGPSVSSYSSARRRRRSAVA